MAKSIEQEVREAMKKLRLLPKEFTTPKRRQILRKAAKPLVNAAKANIPKSSKPHYRYKTSKVTNKLKAPKGKGRIIATYYPGNLRRSIKALTFRKSGSIFVGPRLSKRGKGQGTFGKGNRVDGYYANQMEFGNINMAGIFYMRRAIPVAKQAVQKIIIEESKKKVLLYINKNKV